MGGGKIPERAVHQGDVAVGLFQPPVLNLTVDGKVDGSVEPIGERGRNAIGILDENHLEGGADEVAPVRVITGKRNRARRRLWLLWCSLEGAVPLLAGSAVLLL